MTTISRAKALLIDAMSLSRDLVESSEMLKYEYIKDGYFRNDVSDNLNDAMDALEQVVEAMKKAEE